MATPDGAPAGSSSQVAVPGASLHLKAGALLDPPILSVKANLRPDRGSSTGAILAFDHHVQRLTAIIASADITAMRTGAIAAVAADCLLADRSAVIALVGAGPVARSALRAIRHLFAPANVRVWSRDPEHAARFAGEEQGCTVTASVAEAARGAGLVITCTLAREPLLFTRDLSEGTVVLAMGADTPGKRELGPGVLDGADVLVDVLVDALLVGECAYLQDGSAAVRHIGQLAQHPRPDSVKHLTVFDSVGSSAVDAAAIALLLTRANQADIGARLDLA